MAERRHQRASTAATNRVSLAEVARALEVPTSTLRSWQRRYGILTCPHEAGRRRRYSHEDIHLLRMMRDEILGGRRAALAARSVRSRGGGQRAAAELIARILDASQRFDAAAIRSALDEGRQALGLADCVDEVLLPAMRQVGLWWANGHCEIAQEAMTTEAARAWLDYRNAFAPPPLSVNPILLACGPRDQHTIGLEALAMLLRSRGWSCRMLGARTSTANLLTAAAATRAAAVVVVAHLAAGRPQALHSIESVIRAGVPTFYAGGAFSYAVTRKNVPGQYLGTRLQDACTVLITALSSALT